MLYDGMCTCIFVWETSYIYLHVGLIICGMHNYTTYVVFNNSNSANVIVPFTYKYPLVTVYFKAFTVSNSMVIMIIRIIHRIQMIILRSF